MSEIELDRPESAQRILDTAMALAEQHGWEALRLHHVADQLHINLEQIRSHFRQKDDLIDAWFDLADQAMLRAAASDQIKSLNPVRATSTADADLVPGAGASPGSHPADDRRQVGTGGICICSLTVCFGSAGRCNGYAKAHCVRLFLSTGRWKRLYLPLFFVTSFGQWLFDRSPHHQATRDAVSRRLRRVERFLETTQSGRLPDPFQWFSVATGAVSVISLFSAHGNASYGIVSFSAAAEAAVVNTEISVAPRVVVAAMTH